VFAQNFQLFEKLEAVLFLFDYKKVNYLNKLKILSVHITAQEIAGSIPLLPVGLM